MRPARPSPRSPRRPTSPGVLTRAAAARLDRRAQFARARACRCIQTRWRRTLIDPISLERVETPLVVYRNARPITYDARTLYEYILRSGDVHDPVCRTEFSLDELAALDRKLGRPIKLSRSAALLSRVRRENAMTTSVLDALEREMLRAVGDLGKLADAEACLRFRTDVSMLMVEIFQNMFAMDPLQAIVLMSNLRQCLHTLVSPVAQPATHAHLRLLLAFFVGK